MSGVLGGFIEPHASRGPIVRALDPVKDPIIKSLEAYLNLPKPTVLQVLIISPNMECIETLQKSRFW